MKIKTNLNRVNLIHDQINYPSIERQVMDYIIETKLFETVTFKVKKDEGLIVLNESNYLRMSYDCYHISFNFYGDKYHLLDKERSLSGVYLTIDWKEQGDAETKEMNKYLKNIAAIIEANKTADAIVSQFTFSEEMNKNIEKAIDDHFNNDLIKANFHAFPESLIPQLDNPYTKGIWSWLNFHLIGIKQHGYPKLDKSIGVELFADGKIKYPHIDKFVKAIQCGEYETQCKPSIKEMQSRLAYVSDFEEKVKTFDGTKIPYLQDYLALQAKGVEFRKSLKFAS